MSIAAAGKPDGGNAVSLVLRLYVAGNAPNSQRAVANLERINREYYGALCQIEIVDVFDYPDLALEEGIIVTPTLLKLAPSPTSRIIGDLSDNEMVLATLGHYQVER